MLRLLTAIGCLQLGALVSVVSVLIALARRVCFSGLLLSASAFAVILLLVLAYLFNVRLGPDSYNLAADRLPLWFLNLSRIKPVEQRLFMNADHSGDFDSRENSHLRIYYYRI